MNKEIKLPQVIPSSEKDFEAFFREHYAPLVGFAIKYVKDRDEAEGIVQELFASVWAKAHSITITSSVKAYMFSAVRNACLNYLKHQKIEMAYQKHQQAVLSEVNEENPVEYEELQGRLSSALEQIPEKCRAIFEMNRFEGKRYKEIAEELQLSLKTVENQMGKALKILREELGDYLPLVLWLFTHGGNY